MNIFLRSGFCGLAITFLFAGCMTNPVTGRKELSLVSKDQEMQLGLQSFDQLKKETPISHDPAANAMLQRVGKRIASVAQKDMPNAQWEFVVFDSKEANAFCLPGGKIGVYTGILPIVKDDAGLATVLGHEVAHAVSRHAGERMSEAMALETVSKAAGSYAQGYSGLTQNAVAAAFGIGGPLLVQLPHSRKQESEADQIGLIYMARAGYNPEAAVDFWQRFASYNSKSGDNTPSFLRTHPVDSVRISQIQGWLPEARAQMTGRPVAEPAGSPAVGSQIIGHPK
jgi:predicted Zn-dependent protease